jgi:hypothetical protein
MANLTGDQGLMVNSLDIALVISKYINDNFYQLRSQYVPKTSSKKDQAEGLID